MDKHKNIPLVIAKAGQLPGALLTPPRDTTNNILILCSDPRQQSDYGAHMDKEATYVCTREAESGMRPSSNKKGASGTCSCITLPVPEMHGLG